MARDFRKITAWQRGHALTLRIYQAKSGFPNNELARFIDIATGSASEVEYQLLLAKDLAYLPKDHSAQGSKLIAQSSSLKAKSGRNS